MTIKNRLTMKCQKCSNTVDIEGEKVGRKDLVEKAQGLGWQFINANEQLCPEHRAAKAEKAAKPAKKGAKGKGKAKTLKSKVVKRGAGVIEYS